MPFSRYAPRNGGVVQRQLWTMIDRHAENTPWLHRKGLAEDLGISEAMISMWATGSRPMPLDAAREVVRSFRTAGDPLHVELARLILLDLDVDVEPSAPVVQLADDRPMVERALDLGEEVGDLVREVRRGMADGSLDRDERWSLRSRGVEIRRQVDALLLELDAGDVEDMMRRPVAAQAGDA